MFRYLYISGNIVVSRRYTTNVYFWLTNTTRPTHLEDLEGADGFVHLDHMLRVRV